MQEYFKKIEKNMYPVGTLLTLADHGFNGWLKTTLLPYLNLLHNLGEYDALGFQNLLQSTVRRRIGP
jgi:hypothetical protein